VEVVFCKEVHHMKYGRLAKGRKMDYPESDPWLQTWLRDGVLERLETKILRENPCMAVGSPVALSALPAAPASVQTMSLPSKPGEKRRGRP
jgi:hypothetical protein